MTEQETIEYLSDEETDGMGQRDQHLAVITLAVEYGMETTADDEQVVELAYWQQLDGRRAYLGNDDVVDVDRTISDLAIEAVEYLNSQGVVPSAYDHGERDERAGYGAAGSNGAAGLGDDGADGARGLNGAARWSDGASDAARWGGEGMVA